MRALGLYSFLFFLPILRFLRENNHKTSILPRSLLQLCSMQLRSTMLLVYATTKCSKKRSNYVAFMLLKTPSYAQRTASRVDKSLRLEGMKLLKTQPTRVVVLSFNLPPALARCMVAIHSQAFGPNYGIGWTMLHSCDTTQSALKHLDREGRNQLSVWSVVQFKMKNVRTVSVYSTEHNTCDQFQRQKLYVALCCSSVPSARNINNKTACS